MSFAPADPQFEQRTRASFARQGAMVHLGAVLERVEPGKVEISLPFRPELSQQHGFFHAGILSAIADTAGGYAGFTLFAADAGVLTVEFKINLLAAAEAKRARHRRNHPAAADALCAASTFTSTRPGARHCATGIQTLISLVGRAGVKD